MRGAGAKSNNLFGVVKYFDESSLCHILVKASAPYYLQLLVHDNKGVVHRSIGYPTPCQVGGYKGICVAVKNYRLRMELESGKEWTTERAHRAMSTDAGAMGGARRAELAGTTREDGTTY